MTFGMGSLYSLYLLHAAYMYMYMLYIRIGTCIVSITNHCGHIQ